MTPDDAATNTVSSGPTTNEGARQYSVSGLSDTQTYDIRLFPTENVTVSDTGQVSFADAENNNAGDGEADTGTVVADIEVVNGVSTGVAPDEHVEASPSNGTITFTVDSQAQESVIPVVFLETENDGTLELDANNRPTENFGIGGSKKWIPEEASAGDFQVNVTETNKTADWFVGEADDTADGDDDTPDPTNDGTFFYDSNDTFLVDGAPATMATFEANLSTGDGVFGTYADDPALQSTFRLNDRSPGAPENLAASADSDSQVTLTWDNPTGESPDSFNIYRNDETCADTSASELTQVGTVAGSAANEFEDTGLTAETDYCYSVTSVTDGDESTKDTSDDDATDAAEDVQTLAAGATAAPQSNDAAVTDDNGFSGEVDATDEWQIGFSRPMDAIDNTDTMRVQDADGESQDITCDGTEATCSLNTVAMTFQGDTYEPGELLTVTIGAAYSNANIVDRDGNDTNNNGVLDYPLTITNASGFTSDGGTRTWTPADDPDNTLETGGTPAVDNISPEAIDADTNVADAGVFGDAAGDTVSIDYDEPVTVQNGDTIQIDANGDGTVDVTYTCDDGAQAGEVTLCGCG